MINSKLLKPTLNLALSVALMLPMIAVIETSVVESQQAFAQEQSQRKAKRVESIRQQYIKRFEKIQEAFDAENYGEATRQLDKLKAEEQLNNIESCLLYTSPSPRDS